MYRMLFLISVGGVALSVLMFIMQTGGVGNHGHVFNSTGTITTSIITFIASLALLLYTRKKQTAVRAQILSIIATLQGTKDEQAQELSKQAGITIGDAYEYLDTHSSM